MRFPQRRTLLAHMRTYFITGIAVMAPLAVTVWILWQSFSLIDGLARGIFGQLLGSIPGVGIVVLFLIILLTGIVASDFMGKRLISYGEKIISRIPLANRIYAAIQQIGMAFLGSKSSIFNKVVIVEYPRQGIYTLGLQTVEGKGEIRQKSGEEVVGVFLLTTPNPTTGVLIYVPRKNVIVLEMSIQDSFKQVISAGVYTPSYVRPMQEEPSQPDNVS